MRYKDDPCPECGAVRWACDHWQDNGICPDCGGDCAPECGRHPAGCVFGGFSAGYWLAAPDCDRFHGEALRDGPTRSLDALPKPPLE